MGDFEEDDWAAKQEQAIVVEVVVEIAQKVVSGEDIAGVEDAGRS